MISIDVKRDLKSLAFDLNRLLDENNSKTALDVLHNKSKQFKRYEKVDYVKMRY